VGVCAAHPSGHKSPAIIHGFIITSSLAPVSFNFPAKPPLRKQKLMHRWHAAITCIAILQAFQLTPAPANRI
jgi:hypothetical protein